MATVILGTELPSQPGGSSFFRAGTPHRRRRTGETEVANEYVLAIDQGPTTSTRGWLD